MATHAWSRAARAMIASTIACGTTWLVGLSGAQKSTSRGRSALQIRSKCSSTRSGSVRGRYDQVAGFDDRERHDPRAGHREGELALVVRVGRVEQQNRIARVEERAQQVVRELRAAEADGDVRRSEVAHAEEVRLERRDLLAAVVHPERRAVAAAPVKQRLVAGDVLIDPAKRLRRGVVDPSAAERNHIVGIQAEVDDVLALRHLHDLADWRRMRRPGGGRCRRARARGCRAWCPDRVDSVGHSGTRGIILGGRKPQEVTMAATRRTVLSVVVALLVGGALALDAQESSNPYRQLRYRFIGPDGNRAIAVAGEPGNPLVMYVGAASGGIFKTADGGTTWRSIFDRYGVSSVGSLAIDPARHNVVWAGTGETFLIRPAHAMGNGIYRSDDAGRNWQRMGLEKTGRIGRVVIDPHHPDTVFACALGHAYGPQHERGIYRTRDGGKTWDQVLFVDENTGCADIAIDPSNPQTLFAGMWPLEINTWGLKSGGASGGVYMSRDGGATWHKLSGHGLPAADTRSGRRRSRSLPATRIACTRSSRTRRPASTGPTTAARRGRWSTSSTCSPNGRRTTRASPCRRTTRTGCTSRRCRGACRTTAARRC